MKLISNTRNVSIESLVDYANLIKNSINYKDTNEKICWAAKQTYIALGLLLEAAAIENIDATPMEGFDSGLYNEILGLNDLKLTSVVVCALGYRDEKDEYINMKKVRKDIHNMIIEK